MKDVLKNQAALNESEEPIQQSSIEWMGNLSNDIASLLGDGLSEEISSAAPTLKPSQSPTKTPSSSPSTSPTAEPTKAVCCKLQPVIDIVL